MNHLSKTGATPIDQLRQLQVVAWQRGERLLVEQLLGRSPELPIQDESVLELICAELLLREEAGDVPTAAEYTSRFPHLATELLRQFEVHQLLGTLDGLNSMSALLSGQPAAPVDRAFDVTVLSDQDNGNHREGTSHEKFPDVQGYRILRELGRGGMGVVYQARHLQLNRIVALKMIRDSALASDAVRERFRVEAKAVARLQHPNIVQIYDYSECRGIPFFSLEYVAGGSLAEFTRHQPQPIVASVELVEKLARALDQAHREGIVHRDLKPANIMLTQVRPDGSSVDSTASPSAEIEDGASTLAQLQPKISDFGLAKILTDNQDLTHSAAMLGTCAYMSPEQAWGRSRDVGPATDIHALGLILYELLTGLTPFQSSSMAQSLDLVRFNEPLPPSQSRSEIPPALETICLRCLRKEPGDRYQSMIELADDIRRFLDGHPIAKEPASRRTYRPIAIAAVAIGFVGLIALMSGILSTVPVTSRSA